MSGSPSGASLAVRLARWTLRWRWAVIVLTLVSVGWLASGVRHVRFAGDYRVFFSDDNPRRAAFESLLATYAKNESLLFVVAPESGDVFTPEALAALESLTERAWQLPHSTRVDSLTNFQHTEAEGDDLWVDSLVVGAGRLGPEEVERVRRVALGEPRLVRRLVSPSGHVAGVNVLVKFEASSPEKLAEAVAAARELAEEVRREHPGTEVYLTGAVMLHNAFMEATQEDLRTLVPLMYLGIVVFMLFFLRSLVATFATVVVIALSAAAGMGAAGWLGIALTPVSAVAPTLIMTLAVADSVHVLMTLLQQVGRGSEKREAIVEAMRVNLQPVFLTSFTTAIGFLSMNSSDAPPLHDLGNVTAIGIAAAFFASTFFLPALMAVLPLRARGGGGRESRWMVRLAELTVRRRRPLLWGGVAVVAALAACIPLNDFDDRYVRYFDESVEFRTHTDFATEHLTGIHQVEYSLPAGEAGGVAAPEYLAVVDAFAEWWRGQPEVIHVDTFSDVMKRLNRSLHGDDEAFYRLPESRELAAQYLLLYELSLPYGLDLNHQVDVDRSATRFSVTLEEVSSKELVAIAGRGDAWLRASAPAMATEAVGPSVMFAHIALQNISSMVVGTVVALGLISLTLVVALGSLRFGLISLFPNVVPAILGFGLWGLLVGQVGFLLSIVLAMTLGIVVDDTVHMLSKYLRARRERGLDPEAAVRYAFASVGRAMVATSVVLVAGFLILSLSTFRQNADMGQLTALIIVLALVADFLLLPPLLLEVDSAAPATPDPSGDDR